MDRLPDQEFERLLRQAAALPDAPPALVRAAISLWKTHAPQSPVAAVGAAISRIVADLRFDSWALAPTAAGVRGDTGDSRHLLFNASGRDIDVRIEPAAGQFTVSGQVLGPDESGTVELAGEPGAEGAQPPCAAALDALGEFRLGPVPHGTYRMMLRVGSDEIVLPPIVIGERRG